METENKLLQRMAKTRHDTDSLFLSMRYNGSDVSWLTVRSWVTGKRQPGGANIAALCVVLHCQPADLIT